MALWRVPAYFAMSAAPNSPLRANPEDQGHRFAKGDRWGSFEILALVGRGSFGEVYRAWDPALQREVGLKILLPRSIGGDALLEDLLREARALASVRHPNIVSVYGVDQQDGLVGFWTDFVHGKTLAQLVRQQGPFGYREAALVGLDVAKALSAVHRAGLLHRDIKAENVMREEGGRILLMDFGLSTLPHLQQDVAGTPRYMAPELFAGAAATVASDIYAVGVLLFYLVAGEYPAPRTDAGAAERPELDCDEATAEASGLAGFLPRPRAATGSASRSVVDYRPDLPEGFARIIDTAIHPDPLKRFSSAGALATALSEVLAAPFAGDVPAQVQVEGKKRRSWVRYAAVLAVFLVLASGTLTYLRHGRAFSGLVKSRYAALDASENLNDKYLKADSLLLRYDRRKNVTDAIGLLKEVLAQDPNFALAQAGPRLLSAVSRYPCAWTTGPGTSSLQPRHRDRPQPRPSLRYSGAHRRHGRQHCACDAGGAEGPATGPAQRRGVRSAGGSLRCPRAKRGCHCFGAKSHRPCARLLALAGLAGVLLFRFRQAAVGGGPVSQGNHNRLG
jgi:hypothetical protein